MWRARWGRRSPSRGAGGRRIGDPRQPDDKLAAAIWPRARHGDRAVMQFHQALDERQADSKTSLRTVQRLIGLHERQEDPREHIRRHSATSIPYPEDRVASFRDNCSWAGSSTPRKVSTASEESQTTTYLPVRSSGVPSARGTTCEPTTHLGNPNLSSLNYLVGA